MRSWTGGVRESLHQVDRDCRQATETLHLTLSFTDSVQGVIEEASLRLSVLGGDGCRPRVEVLAGELLRLSDPLILIVG